MLSLATGKDLLIRNKEAVKRAQDLADLARLRPPE
jgi:hypothetical protein